MSERDIALIRIEKPPMSENKEKKQRNSRRE
jgi:hypothetical protein